MLITELDTMRRLSNRRIGPIYFQSGHWSRVLRSKAQVFVLLGDAKILSNWVLAFLLRLRGKPVAFWTIGWHRPERGVKRLTRLAFYRLATHLLIYGEGGRRIGEMMGYPKSRMTVIGNSVAPPDERRPTEGERRRIVYVGRLTAAKELGVLLEAVGGDPILRSQVGIDLVGDGAEREGLTRLADNLQVKATFHGEIHDLGRLESIYSRAFATVIPGAAGLTVIQSMAFGVPVISHDDPYSQMPEYEAIDPGVTGELFRRGDRRHLAEVILRWMNLDSAARARAQVSCIRTARVDWSPERHATRIVSALLDLSKAQS